MTNEIIYRIVKGKGICNLCKKNKPNMYTQFNICFKCFEKVDKYMTKHPKFKNIEKIIEKIKE